MTRGLTETEFRDELDRYIKRMFADHKRITYAEFLALGLALATAIHKGAACSSPPPEEQPIPLTRV